jgi:hypothetical protein
MGWQNCVTTYLLLHASPSLQAILKFPWTDCIQALTLNVINSFWYLSDTFLIPFCKVRLQKGIRKVSERYQKIARKSLFTPCNYHWTGINYVNCFFEENEERKVYCKNRAMLLGESVDFHLKRNNWSKIGLNFIWNWQNLRFSTNPGAFQSANRWIKIPIQPGRR